MHFLIKSYQVIVLSLDPSLDEMGNVLLQPILITLEKKNWFRILHLIFAQQEGKTMNYLRYGLFKPMMKETLLATVFIYTPP
jgi:hypothetical protein